jgi:hypothetical protein
MANGKKVTATQPGVNIRGTFLACKLKIVLPLFIVLDIFFDPRHTAQVVICQAVIFYD